MVQNLNLFIHSLSHSPVPFRREGNPCERTMGSVCWPLLWCTPVFISQIKCKRW